VGGFRLHLTSKEEVQPANCAAHGDNFVERSPVEGSSRRTKANPRWRGQDRDHVVHTLGSDQR
jgi:hypothetical protein